MPNYVQNIIKITGYKSHLIPMLKSIQNENEGIDFNKIIPMPEELEGTRSPASIVSVREYKKWMKESAFRDDRFPIGSPITKKMSEDLIARFGYNNWYDWRINNWGVKWNAGDTIINDPIPKDDKGNIEVVILFQTAWSSCAVILQTHSNNFPTLDFHLTYADEDCGFNVGDVKFKNGCIVESDFPEGGSNDAMELYFTCWDSDREGWEMKDGKWEYTDEW